MLADPRSEALATRFAAQWLRLQDIEKVHPDALQFPDFDEQLADAMRRETELFFNNLVRENRSVLELFTRGLHVRERALARHYGIPGVAGPEFRRVAYPDDRAARAARPRQRPHADVAREPHVAGAARQVGDGGAARHAAAAAAAGRARPRADERSRSEGRMLTTRERMEMHRANPACRSCHQFMDPIGLALDNFDVTGQWRIRENGMPLDTRGRALRRHAGLEPGGAAATRCSSGPMPLLRTFTQNLMAYALGRRVEYYDLPTVRAIARDAEAERLQVSSTSSWAS